jgi:hypothetical protein
MIGFWVLLIEGMIFSEKVRGTHLLRKNHPWILQPWFLMWRYTLYIHRKTVHLLGWS